MTPMANQVTVSGCKAFVPARLSSAIRFLLYLGIALCGVAPAQTLAPTWTQQTPATSPPQRYIHAMTYDSGRGQVVLFGGFGGSGYLNDTWLWNGTTWAQANPVNSPSNRAAAQMVYDPLHGQVVLFGGLASVSNRLGDTWLWDGTNWTQATPANSPPARGSGVMVYDAATSQVLLFGGVNASGFEVNDTWAWDGANWTQLSPTTSPSVRADYSMVYDAATGQVVLFGGDSNGQYQNDTWVWNGTNWIQQSPSNSPPARYAQGMAYSPALGVVMFGGYNGAFLNDTWVWNGSNWTQDLSPANPAGRYAPNGMVYDAAQNQVVLFAGLGNSNGDYSDTWVWGQPGNFGNVNVCPSGQTTPAPCSSSLTLTYNLAGAPTLGTPQVVTQGTSGLDFALGTGSTCTGTVQGTCTVNVTFTPTAPGPRLGAVEIFDYAGILQSTNSLYGNGQAPAVVFRPSTQIQINTGAYSLNQPKGLAVDAAQNIFIANTGAHNDGTQSIVKVPSIGAPTVVASGFLYPQGLAVDGAGDLFVADNDNNQVIEVPAGCTTSSCQKVIGTGLVAQLAVAVDPFANVFISDFNDGLVAEIPANGSGQTTVYYGGTTSQPDGLAVDAAGDLFISDFGLNKVIEVPAGCTVSGCQTSIGSGWSRPESLAVDAAGDVFVADFGLQEIVEVPAGCTSASCQSVLVSGIQAFAVALDATGNLYYGNIANNGIYEMVAVNPPASNFSETNVGDTSGPVSFVLQNVGNQTLNAVAPGLRINAANFVQVAGPGAPADCTTSFSLAPGAQCNVSIDFAPQIGGPISDAIFFTDNSFNSTSVTQAGGLAGAGVQVTPVTVAVPNVVALTQTAATTAVTGATLAVGAVTSAFSSTIPTGSVVSQSPSAGTQATAGSLVSLVISTGQPPAANQLSLNNNYFVTGDYVSAGVTLRGTGVGGIATGAITIPSNPQGGNQGVPNGADILAAYLYWSSIENTSSPSSANGTFLGYSITGQQIGSDQAYTDGALSGTLRVYRANVNAYLPVGANGIRSGSGAYTVSLPDGGGSALPLTEGASLVVIYRVLSPNFPLKSIVLYDGSAIPTTATGALTQTVQGFYDAVGGANGSGENTNIFAGGGTWNNSASSVKLGQPNQYTETLSPGNAYAAVILSTPVNNSDNDGILDAWKAGPAAGDVHAGQPGYYDVTTGNFVSLPGAQHGHKDLFVQLDYMCSAILANGACDFTQENLYPSPDTSGNDPIAMVQQAFANSGVSLHLQIGNAVPETTCVDNGTQLCEFPNEPGVVSWDNSVEISKVWPRNFSSCASGGDCTARFAYGQKDSWHYVLFGFSLAIPAWNTRYGTLTSINVVNGVTTIGTTDRGAGINACPSRITLSGVLGNPSLNGVYNTTSCSGTTSITVATPGVPNWSYPNSTLPEPVIGLTSGTVSSISGYSDLGGSDSAVTLGLWETAPNQDMSKAANVIAGTLFHEIGHTLGLSHGGLYYDTPGSFVPTFEANCKPNFQSSMNYLFQLDGVGPNLAVAFSNQSLTTVTEATAGSVTQLTDSFGNAATFPTSSWYVPYTAGTTTASPATRHCDGTPLTNDSAYRVDGPIAPITPAWTNGQNIAFDGQSYTSLRGYNDVANMDLRQVAATGGEFASLASVLNFGSSAAPLNLAAGGSASLGSGGTVTLGSGGTVTLGSGGNVTLGSGGTITLGSGGNVTLGSGGNVTLGSGGVVTPGSSGTVTLGSGGNVTLGSGGTITLGSGGNVTLGSGGNVTLGSGGTITLGSGGTPIVIAPGGSYVVPAGGTVTLGSGGNVTLGSGGNVTLGSGGTIALGSGGNVTLGSGGNVTLGSGGTIALGSGGNVTLGSGGNVTLGSGGTIALGSGGNITLGSGGNVTLGSGGTVTLGSGGVSAGGGNITLGSGGNVTLGSGGTVTLGSGGNVTLGSGGNVTLGSGGTIALGSGGTVTLGSGGNVTLGSGGTITLGSGGNTITIAAGGSYTIPASGGTVTLGSGGNVTLGSGGNVTLGSGGTITLGSGGNITLGSGGNVTLGSGGVVTLGSGGNITLGSGGNVTLGSGGNVTLGSGGAQTNELTYETANSVVRPPSSPTETPLTTSGSPSVQVNWTAPVFGVVQTYTIYRSSDGGTPVAIGSVSGVNGNPPATTFLDTNPDLTSKTVVYTITTTLAPVPIDPTTRSSQQSAPAVLSNNQSITLGPLPSSVTASSSTVTVTATALSSGVPNGQQVSFSAAGSPAGACSVGNTSINGNGVSSATVAINTTGSCKVTASQAGSSPLLLQTGTPPFYNAADPVSGTFMILPANSGTTSQTINFAALGNVQYGGTFSLIASSSAPASAGQTVTFSASGPCKTNGTTTGAGLCTIIASTPGNSTYSAASVSQSFTVLPAVLKVTATSFAIPYGQPLPVLTYAYSGFMNGDSSSVVSGAPVLTTTAVATSNPGNYPITVSTGTLAAANYSFLYVPGTLAIQLANQAPLTLTTSSPLIYNQSETLTASGGTTGGAVMYSVLGPCSINGAQLTATSGTGTCQVTATMAGNSTYNPVTSTPANVVNLAAASQAILFTKNPPASAAYKSSFSVAATGGASGNAVAFTSAGACSNVGPLYTMTSGKGTCSVIANQAGNSNYGAAPQVTLTVLPALVAPSVTFTGAPLTAVYGSSFVVATTTNSSTTAVISASGACSNIGTSVTMTSGTGTCSLMATWAADSDYAGTTATQSTAATLAAPAIVWPAPAAITYGTALSAAQLNASSTVPGIFSYTPASGILAAGIHSLSVKFTPNVPTNYSTVIASVMLTVNQATPVITWANPAAINYGTALSSTQLNATANVQGMFSYSPVAGTVLPGGTQTLSVVFTPNDSVDYKKQTASVLLVVHGSTVVITGVSSGTQTYGVYDLAIGPTFTGSRVPTGTVTVFDNGNAVVKLPLLGKGLAYWITIPPLNVGVNNLTATYSGDSYYPAGISAVTSVTVVPAPVNIQAACSGGQFYGSTYQCLVSLIASLTALPTGSMTYSLDGGASVSVPVKFGLAAFAIPTAPSVGAHTLVLSYAAQGNFAAATPVKESFTTQPGQTQIQLSAANSTPAAGSSVALSGCVTTPVSGTPAGNVTVLDGATVLGTAPIGAKGTFAYTVSGITKGTHNYTAKYAATQDYAAAISKVVAVTAH